MKFSKLFYATSGFNLHVLGYNKNKKVTKFLNLTFKYGLVPVNNKPTRVKKTTLNAIDHTITNSLSHRAIDTGIVKLDVLDHFPIFLIVGTGNRMTLEGKVQVTKQLINYETNEKFQNALQETARNEVFGSKII